MSSPRPHAAMGTDTEASTVVMASGKGYTTVSTQCRQCGGSGILRHGDQQFRTCLDCLGQGQLKTSDQGNTLRRLIEGSWSGPLSRGLSDDITVVTNASASR